MKSEKTQKKAKKLKSINSRLMLSFSIFAVLVIFFVSIVGTQIIVSSLTDQAQNRIINVGEEAIFMLERTETVNGEPLDAQILDVYIKETEERENATVYVISPDGEVVLPYGRTLENSQEIVENIENRLSKIEKDSHWIFNEGDSLNFAASVDCGEEYFLLISIDLSIVNSTIKTFRVNLLIISLIILIIAFIVSYSLSQKFSNPLKSISKTAVEIAKGNYDVNYVSAEYQEIAQLSDSLNYAKEEIKKSETFQKELLANVSHDLKTPLTMIKAYASMIKEISGDNPEKRDQHLQIIIEEADRLTGLVNDVLNVSKISADIDKINTKVFNLTDLLYGIISKFEYLSETQGYMFMVDIDADLYTCADENKISQALYNLISNAVNYTGDDKTVYISLKNDPIVNRIKFSVRDTGKGIAKEDLPEIWERYYRGKEEHARPVKGTGLGLNIVKTVLTKHAFDFGVNSEKGKGSTFWIDFPAISSKIEL